MITETFYNATFFCGSQHLFQYYYIGACGVTFELHILFSLSFLFSLYRPRSRGDNTFGSVRLSVRLSVRGRSKRKRNRSVCLSNQLCNEYTRPSQLIMLLIQMEQSHGQSHSNIIFNQHFIR